MLTLLVITMRHAGNAAFFRIRKSATALPLPGLVSHVATPSWDGRPRLYAVAASRLVVGNDKPFGPERAIRLAQCFDSQYNRDAPTRPLTRPTSPRRGEVCQ